MSATPAQRPERAFFTAMAFLAAAAVILGFAPSFYLKGALPLSRPVLPLTPLVVLHGVLFTGWILLFITQVLLVARGKIALHRSLGMAGAGLAVAMVAVGVTTALYGAARGSGPPGNEPLAFLVIPFFSLATFAVMIAAGLLNRRDPGAHKRYMLLATIGILDAAIARWPFALMRNGPPAFFAIEDLYILALVAYDFLRLGRVHRATIIGGLFVVAMEPLALVTSTTATWHAFAAWAVGLVK